MNITEIWDRYIAGGGLPDATSFGVWLIREQPAFSEKKSSLTGITGKNQPAVIPIDFQSMDHNTRAAILVGRLERFLHHLTKAGMKEAGMTEDEFGILATLLYMTRATKTQLLKQCLIEIPTGSELLKRMKKGGLILEKKNPEDARSAYILISAKGRATLFKAFFHLGKTEDALTVLSATEKDTLVDLLDRLDLHHSNRHAIRQVKDLMR